MEKEILCEVRNHVGLLTLNRPAVLNALSYSMIKDMTVQLKNWERDDSVHAVLVQGGGGKAFCAGGDIRALYKSYKENDSLHHDYFVAEYRLDYLTHRYPKPYIALMDGIVMGGGVGISQGACLRIAGDKTRFAMPETGIGLFPDVGASHFLARMQPELELYLGVTGRDIQAPDALYCGLADVYLPPAALADLDEVLSVLKWGSDHRGDIFNAIIPLGQRSLPDPPLLGLQGAIYRHFRNRSIAAIMDSLSKESSPAYREWANETLTIMKKRSPLMMCVTMRQLQTGRHLELADCFRMELGLVRHCFEHGDFIEGIRALIIDKDNNPRWNPSRIEDVSEEMIKAFFLNPWSETRHPLADLRTDKEYQV
jgi:enoyl-CoA hydratase/carnithine racemase